MVASVTPARWTALSNATGWDVRTLRLAAILHMRTGNEDACPMPAICLVPPAPGIWEAMQRNHVCFACLLDARWFEDQGVTWSNGNDG